MNHETQEDPKGVIERQRREILKLRAENDNQALKLGKLWNLMPEIHHIVPYDVLAPFYAALLISNLPPTDADIERGQQVHADLKRDPS